MRLPLTILILANLGFGSALKCACFNDVSCVYGQLCHTEKGICFASIFKDEDKNEVIERQKCLEEDQLWPKKRPLLCEYNRRRSDKYVSKCCSDRDYCTALCVFLIFGFPPLENWIFSKSFCPLFFA